MPKPRHYWTFERCAEEAKRFRGRWDFMRGSKNAYNKAREKGWLDEICPPPVRIPPPLTERKWSLETCVEIAAKYNHASDLKKNDKQCYDAIHRNNWKEFTCAHMTLKGNTLRRHVYEIADHFRKIIYIGLTCSPEQRIIAHRNKSKRITSQFLPPIVMSNISELMTAEDARREEDRRITFYSEKGYRILNVAKAGGLGGSTVKWTFQRCVAAAKDCQNVSDMPKSAYNRCVSQNWLPGLYAALPHLRKSRSKY